MLTGSRALWEMADALGVVPTPPNGPLARLLAAWWERPRTFACSAAKTDPTWVVIAPDPSISCPRCAVVRFEREQRCIYCGDLTTRPDLVLAFEMTGEVRVLARAHENCHERK
jgi:hypothetical protein